MFKMATSKNNGRDREETNDNCCSTCKETESVKEGKRFCVDCGVYFCDQCLQHHNKFQALRSHKIKDKHVGFQSESGSTEADELTERCPFHHGQVLDRFCQEHDEVCCQGCIAIKHRYCLNVGNIKDVARGVMDGTEYTGVTESLQNIITRIQQEQVQRNSNVASLDEEKKQALRDIDKFQDDIINRIKEIADASRQEIESKHVELVTQLNGKDLESVLTVTQDASKKVNAGQNEAEIFTNIKLSKKVVSDVDNSVNDMSFNWHPKQLCYCINTKAAEKLLSLKTFGIFTKEIRPLQATSNRKTNVKLSSDNKTCGISGICILEDGSYIVSDYRNNNVKRFNTNFEAIDNINLNVSDLPFSLCNTGPQEVAATKCVDHRVQFISCDKTLSLGGTIYTEKRHMGLCFDSKQKEMYVSCGAKFLGHPQSKVIVYTREGTLLRRYENDESAKPMFSSANNIVISPRTDAVYVTDCENGLVAFTKSGRKLWVYNDKNYKKPGAFVCFQEISYL